MQSADLVVFALNVLYILLYITCITNLTLVAVSGHSSAWIKSLRRGREWITGIATPCFVRFAVIEAKRPVTSVHRGKDLERKSST